VTSDDETWRKVKSLSCAGDYIAAGASQSLRLRLARSRWQSTDGSFGSARQRLLHLDFVSEIDLFQPLREICLAGRCLQHDMPLHQRINAIGGGERFFQ
jgi:hypothetical protein